MACVPVTCLQVAANGSVQELDIPENLKSLYRTVWEIKQRSLVDMAADRGAYIDQSQSFNVFMPDPNFGKLTSLHFYAWKKGLKTGMYYLRTRCEGGCWPGTPHPSMPCACCCPAVFPCLFLAVHGQVCLLAHVGKSVHVCTEVVTEHPDDVPDALMLVQSMQASCTQAASCLS